METREVIYRHSGPVRITHWVNALVLLVLLMSGLQIFNAHPALYIGAKSNFDDPILAMQPMMHDDKVHGVTTLFGWQFDTTGVFGLAGDAENGYDDRGFPWSVTLPGHRDLSLGRRWHFFFAWLFLFNGLAYLLWSLGSGHLRRDLAPDGQGAQAYRRLDRRACPAQIPQRRRGQALQRSAKAQLSRRCAGASAADAGDRAGHVAGHGRRLPHPARCASAAGRRRAPSISSRRA